MSIAQAVKELYPELDEQEQQEMVTSIKLETGTPLLQGDIDGTVTGQE
jgi:hypothetical protein